MNILRFVPQRHCRECDKILTGKKGTADVSENYIQVKGSLSLQMKSDDTGQRYHIPITESETEHVYFCDLVCMQEYFDFKEKARKEEWLKAKREMNAREWATGKIGGGYSHRGLI